MTARQIIGYEGNSIFKNILIIHKTDAEYESRLTGKNTLNMMACWIETGYTNYIYLFNFIYIVCCVTSKLFLYEIWTKTQVTF